MGRRTGLLAPAVAMVLCTACSLPFGLGRPRSPAPERARPVALITEGAVFARPGVRAAVVAALKRATRRRVIVVAAPSPAADPRVQRLASRFAKDNPHIATYDWREPQCAAESVVLDREQAGKRVGPHTRAPDHRVRRYLLAGLEGDSRRVN